MNDEFLDKAFSYGIFTALVAFGLWMMFWVVPADKVKRQERQQQIDTFYVQHNCRPEGYVATKYEPMRTYRCDTGLFVAGDMK